MNTATLERQGQVVAVDTRDAPQRLPAIAGEAESLMAIISRAASDPSIDINKLERLMQMHEQITARAAKAAYDAALAQMQPELPVIAERGRIDIGRGKPQSYALWEDINEAIRPILSRHGFALSFRTGRQDDRIIVTGILSHRDGHREETTMHLPLDTSGSKNNVQAVGSSTSYGKRYTASALLNLTSRGEDDDGKAGGAKGPITEAQAEQITKLIAESKSDVTRFLKWAGAESISDIPAAKFADAVAMLQAKKNGKAS